MESRRHTAPKPALFHQPIPLACLRRAHSFKLKARRDQQRGGLPSPLATPATAYPFFLLGFSRWVRALPAAVFSGLVALGSLRTFPAALAALGLVPLLILLIRSSPPSRAALASMFGFNISYSLHVSQQYFSPISVRL